ncbi:MAG: amidase [Proteobacteria bacterium]|nr:amidase [Pseudomonadota bacterium]
MASDEQPGGETNARREFLLTALGAAATAAIATAAPGAPSPGVTSGRDELDRLDALALGEQVRRGALSARTLLERAIRRIEERNGAINAIAERCFELAEAQVDAGVDRHAPFAGVPFLLKDLWCDLPGTISTQGSRFWRDYRPGTESEIVRRFRRAGLVIVGRSATPELGLSPTTETLLRGATRNPWNHSRSCGGSSGGAAAAVAAGLVPVAHATDGGGSIRIPASCCGLFGLKPTRARTPAGPQRTEGWSGLSCGHAVTRSVRDSAALLDAISGAEPGDAYAAPAHGSFLAATRRTPPRLRIALMRTPLAGTPVDPACLAAADAAAKLLTGLGHQVEEARPPLDSGALARAFGAIVAVEVREALEDRAAALGRPWGADDVEPVTAALAAWGAKVDGVAHARARVDCGHAGRLMAGFMADWDVILSPTLARPPAPLGELAQSNPDFEAWGRSAATYSPFTSVANMTGQPAMSLPLHVADGLPIGVQCIGRFGEEELLYSLAAQVESAAPWAHRLPVD